MFMIDCFIIFSCVAANTVQDDLLEFNEPMNDDGLITKAGLTCDESNCTIYGYINATTCTKMNEDRAEESQDSCHIGNDVYKIENINNRTILPELCSFEDNHGCGNISVDIEFHQRILVGVNSTAFVLFGWITSPRLMQNEIEESYFTEEPKGILLVQFYVYVFENRMGKIQKLDVSYTLHSTVHTYYSLSRLASDKFITRGKTGHCISWANNTIHRKKLKRSKETVGKKFSCRSNTTFIGFEKKVVVTGKKKLITISIIFIGISSLFLLVTFSVLVRFRETLRKANDRTNIQINLTFAFLMQHISLIGSFAVSMFASDWDIGCEAATIIHTYFLYVCIVWVLMEGLVLIKKIFLTSSNLNFKHQLAMMGISWVVPVICHVVIILVENGNDSGMGRSSRMFDMTRESPMRDKCSNKKNLLKCVHKYDLCFTMSSTLYLIICITLISLVFLTNLAIAISVTVVIWSKRMADKLSAPANNVQDRSSITKEQVYSTLKSVILLMVVLGIPWLISLTFVISSRLAKHFCPGEDCLSFTTLTIHFVTTFIQGPSIFYVNCYLNANLRIILRRRYRNNCDKKGISSR